VIANVSQIVVLIFGGLLCGLCGYGIVVPRALLGLVKGVINWHSGIYVAIAVRVVLGLALLFAAEASILRSLFRILGWVAIVAAVGVALMGRARLQKLVGWFDRVTPAFVRLWLVGGIAFAGILLFGAW
jgi:hypothetical protein